MGKENLENPEKKFTSVGAKIQEAQKSEFLVCTVHTELKFSSGTDRYR